MVLFPRKKLFSLFWKKSTIHILLISEKQKIFNTQFKAVVCIKSFTVKVPKCKVLSVYCTFCCYIQHLSKTMFWVGALLWDFSRLKSAVLGTQSPKYLRQKGFQISSHLCTPLPNPYIYCCHAHFFFIFLFFYFFFYFFFFCWVAT